MSRQHAVVNITLVAMLVGIVAWTTLPVLTFGGRYRHHETQEVYEFHNGRFIVNGNDIGRYSVHIRTVTIRLDLEHGNEAFPATIGWNTISIPIPKYGQSVLHRDAL